MQLNKNTFQLSLYPLLLICPFFFWGTAMVAMKGAIEHTTPLFIASIRLLPAGLLVLAVAIGQKRPQPQTVKAWLWIVFFALVDGAMFQGFLTEGLARINAGLGSVMIDSQPLAVALLSSFLFGEVIGSLGWLGLIIGILGISLIGLPEEFIYLGLDTSKIELSSLWQEMINSGELLMLMAALSMAVGTVTIRLISRHADPLMATAWHMIIGGFLLFLLTGWVESQQLLNLNIYDWMGLLYATIFGSAIAYGVFFYLASQGDLTSFSALTFLTPVFALIFSGLFLGESLTNVQWVGVCLTLLSIYLINQRSQIIFNLSKLKDILSRKIQQSIGD